MREISSSDQIRRNLTQTVVARPLLDHLEDPETSASLFDVIIDPNLEFSGGGAAARARIESLIAATGANAPAPRHDAAHPYVFATLTAQAIRDILVLDASPSTDPIPVDAQPGQQRLADPGRAIHRIWEDPDVHALITSSVATIKADGARAAFGAEGKGIVWAVADSGIDTEHPHFARHATLTLASPLEHRDFTPGGNSPLTDAFGHGSHVAGIIAGAMEDSAGATALVQTRDTESGAQPLGCAIRGMAPQCRLLSLKVLNAEGKGKASAVIEALAYVQKLNDYGRRVVVHGVNLSLGYSFLPEWFACGQSPLCVEVNRLVKSGVAVVVAAGNSGYGSIGALSGSISTAGLPLTINDPGNAELAITVGATHRDMPHTYGVSYFSSKGPTGDGRLKPDLVAPGERILSCAAGRAKSTGVQYVEDSGTSMAAPHVSGAIAAFLSVRREYIGQPEEVKKLFMASATDLKRDRTFQGAGLIDLMRAIQAV